MEIFGSVHKRQGDLEDGECGLKGKEEAGNITTECAKKEKERFLEA